MIKSLSAQATDPRLKEHHGYYVEFYDDCLRTLETAFHYLKTGYLRGVSVQNKGVYVCINDCDEELSE
ncbi:hypothetical protein FEM48_Zijuj03G0056100 [Ziziphus jujuba var. spinosa]|uniref:Uncharacterized protein n=1 Tax=Ziziphus jujuba var. spinosa TaxID=714518 RepID=A0A978VNH5_ZIZJJ|nr:hypothetical protein FEM48_Zijuj03G0056100 [Ziziphus jujuba var. spinosa]